MSAPRSIRWTKRALLRLEEIGDYIAKDNPLRAESFIAELVEKVDILKTHNLGSPGRVHGTKELVLHKNYMAAYRLHQGEIQILTIFHAAQNR